MSWKVFKSGGSVEEVEQAQAALELCLSSLPARALRTEIWRHGKENIATLYWGSRKGYWPTYLSPCFSTTSGHVHLVKWHLKGMKAAGGGVVDAVRETGNLIFSVIDHASLLFNVPSNDSVMTTLDVLCDFLAENDCDLNMVRGKRSERSKTHGIIDAIVHEEALRRRR